MPLNAVIAGFRPAAPAIMPPWTLTGPIGAAARPAWSTGRSREAKQEQRTCQAAAHRLGLHSARNCTARLWSPSTSLTGVPLARRRKLRHNRRAARVDVCADAASGLGAGVVAECRPDLQVGRQTCDDSGDRHPFMIRRILASQQAGLVLVIVLLGVVLSAFAGSHVDRVTGQPVNNFLNSYTLIQTATDASFFAIMAVGATIVIISGGIDLSVGSIYALAGVTTAMVLRAHGAGVGASRPSLLGLGVSLGVGLACGAVNGLMVVGLGVHPFIITLGTMWILRGVAFVASSAESILLPPRADARRQGVARPRRSRSIRCRCW